MAEDQTKRSTFSIKVTFNQYNDLEQEANIYDDEDCQKSSKSNAASIATTNCTCNFSNRVVGNKQLQRPQQISSQSCSCVSQRECNNGNMSHRCDITLHGNQQQQVHCCDHFKTCNPNENNNHVTFINQNKPKQFRYIQPQNHKSSLFVNLSQDIDNNLEASNRRRDNLFVSPDLDINLEKYSTIVSSASISPNYEDINPSYDKPIQGDMFSCLYANTSSSQTDLTQEVSASRRESFVQVDYSDIDSMMAQLTNSTDTTTNTLTISDAHDDVYMDQQRETFTQPPKDLDICNLKDQKLILTELDLVELGASTTDEDWVQVLSMDPETYAKQLIALQEEIDLSEGYIAKLERKRRVGSQTCITKIIKQRRNIRDLQAQVYERKLNEKSLFTPDQNLASPSDLKHFDDNCKKLEVNKSLRQLEKQTTSITTNSTTNDYQPTLRPGIEDTAYILDTVPPPPGHQ